ncbi:MAG: hypothetical protein EBT86_01085 [Actinobacteria bacterium]|nr:hypothetical protein [Actinomycetota bacterium]
MIIFSVIRMVKARSKSHKRTCKNLNLSKLNPKKLLNMTANSLKKILKVGSNIYRKTVKTTRGLLKTVDKKLSKLS